MERLLKSAALAVAILTMGMAGAHTIKCKSSDACDVFCDGGAFVGTMYWNGTKWSDGIRSSESKDELAKLMVAAQGSACR